MDAAHSLAVTTMSLLRGGARILHIPLKDGILDYDPGHDSPQEQAACTAVEKYARSTGPLGGGGSIVQAFENNGRTVVGVWMNPHFDDPIVVRLSANRTLWAYCDNPDNGLPPARSWKSFASAALWAEGKHVVAIDQMIRPLFFGTQPSRDEQPQT
jgi:hypothetical protein